MLRVFEIFKKITTRPLLSVESERNVIRNNIIIVKEIEDIFDLDIT